MDGAVNNDDELNGNSVQNDVLQMEIASIDNASA